MYCLLYTVMQQFTNGSDWQDGLCCVCLTVLSCRVAYHVQPTWPAKGHLYQLRLKLPYHINHVENKQSASLDCCHLPADGPAVHPLEFYIEGILGIVIFIIPSTFHFCFSIRSSSQSQMSKFMGPSEKTILSADSGKLRRRYAYIPAS